MRALEFLKEPESASAFLSAPESASEFLMSDSGPELSNTPTGALSAIKRVPTAIREDYETATEGSDSSLFSTENVKRGIGAIFSPLTGTSKALVGEPVERTAQDAGLSPRFSKKLGSVAQVGAELAVPGVGLTKLPKMAAKAAEEGAEFLPRSVSAQAATAKPLDSVSEAASGVKESAREFLRQVSRVGSKSVSYLDEPAKYSPTLKALREEIEHSDLPGKGTQQLDFNERTLLKTGEFTKRFNEAKAGLKTNPETLRPLLDDVRKYANEAGLDIGYVKGYFPRVYDSDRLSKPVVGNDFIKKLSEYGIDQADADIILRNLTDGDGIVTTSGAGRSTISRIAPEMQRKLGDIPDLELAPFLKTNPDEVIPKYISAVSRRAEYARTFGPNNEKLDSARKDIIGESVQSGRPIKTDELKRLDDLAQLLAGDYQRISSKGLRTTNDLVTTYQYVRTLPLSVLSSLTEPFIAMERGGLKAFTKAIPATLDAAARATIRTAFKSVPKAQAKKELEEIGLGLDESLAQVLSDQFSGGASTKVQNVFFKAIGLSPWTRLTQIHAMKTAQNMIRDNLKAVASGKGNARIERELMDLGIDPKAKMDATRMKAATLRFVNETIMHPRGTVKPMAMSNPKFKLVMMLKGYHLMAGNTVVKRMLYKVVKGTPVEKARVAGAVGLMLSTALLSDRIRNYIKYGDEGNPRQSNETGMDIFWRALNRTGLTGVFQFANDAVNAQRFGSTGLQQLAGPAISQAQEFVEGGKAASQGKPAKLQTETINALPFINLTPRTRQSAKEFLFGR